MEARFRTGPAPAAPTTLAGGGNALAETLAGRIEGALSHAMRPLLESVPHDETPGVTRRLRREAGTLLHAGLDVASRCASFAGRRLAGGDARVRLMEFRNKVGAFRRFEGRDDPGAEIGQSAIGAREAHSRLFAAEGHAYRGARGDNWTSQVEPTLSLVAFHAGTGLRRAERALARISSGTAEETALAEFYAVCRREAVDGFVGIMEEALGLAARTLYPHLMGRLDTRLRTIDARSWERFWHGAGRGIYFAPANLPPFHAAPWRGVAMCSREAPHELGKRNALSGFAFALTLVNLPQPEILEAFLDHHAVDAAECLDGARAAMVLWSLSGGGGKLPPTEERWRPERLFSARRAAARSEPEGRSPEERSQ
jgi:hypothetical protein